MTRTARKRNPVKILLWVLIILVIAVIAIMLFWKQKTDPITGEVGRIGVDDQGLSAAKKTPTTAKAPVTSPPPASQADDPLTIEVE